MFPTLAFSTTADAVPGVKAKFANKSGAALRPRNTPSNSFGLIVVMVIYALFGAAGFAVAQLAL
jgi:hypothetical protein